MEVQGRTDFCVYGKEVKGVEVSHYGNELRDKTPISLEEFDEICESKEG